MLRQEAESAVPHWQHTPPVPSVPGRFDKEATLAILEAAAQRQIEEETLTQAEIETMAAEMGIAPRHVRRVIAGTPPATQATQHQETGPELTRSQLLLLLLTPLWYAACTIFLATSFGGKWGVLPGPAALLTLGTPVILSLWQGYLLRRKGLGVMAASFLFGALTFSVIVGTLLSREDFLQQVLMPAWRPFLSLLVALAAGIVGGALGQWREMRHSPTVQGQ